MSTDSFMPSWEHPKPAEGGAGSEPRRWRLRLKYGVAYAVIPMHHPNTSDKAEEVLVREVSGHDEQAEDPKLVWVCDECGELVSRAEGATEAHCAGALVMGTAHDRRPMRASEVVEALRAELAASAHRETVAKHQLNDLERALGQERERTVAAVVEALRSQGNDLAVPDSTRRLWHHAADYVVQRFGSSVSGGEHE